MIFPLPVLEGVFLEGVLEISPEHINQIFQFHTLLEQTLVTHIGIPHVGLFCQINLDN